MPVVAGLFMTRAIFAGLGTIVFRYDMGCGKPLIDDVQAEFSYGLR